MAPLPREVDLSDPTFDASSLTIPQLKTILQSQGVILPSSARKAALVQALEEVVDSNKSRTAGGNGAGKGTTVPKKVKPRQSAPATIDQSSSTTRPSAQFPRSETSRPAHKGFRQDGDDDEPVFSDYNPFQSPSGNESGEGRGVAAKAATKPKKDRRKTIDASSGRNKELVSSPPPEEAERFDRRRMPSSSSSRASKDNSDKSGSSSSPPKPRSSSASFRNFMDPSLAASAKPRVMEAVRKGISRFSPAPKQEEDDDEDVEDDEEEDQDRRLEELEEEDELDPEEEEEDSIVSSGSEGARADASRDAYSSPPRSPSAQVLSRSKKAQSKLRYQSNYNKVEELSTSEKAIQILWASLILITIAWGLWYVRESKSVGFCDTGLESNELLRSRERDILARRARAALRAEDSHSEDEDDEDGIFPGLLVPQSLRPSCTSCPSHALCKCGSLQGCSSSDYVLSPSIWTYLPILPRLLPLSKVAPHCVPDAHKLVLAAELGDEVGKVLSGWRGGVLCGGVPPHQDSLSLSKGKNDENASLYKFAYPEKELKADLADRRDKDLVDDSYFSQLWDLALEELERRGSVLRINPSTLDTLDPTKVNTDLLVAKNASVSLSCSAKLAFGSFLRRTRSYFIAAILGLGLVSWMRYKWKKERAERKKVKELVGVALERLQEQEYSHAVDPVLTPEPYLPTSHLRDHVLSSEHSTKARQRLWSRVARIVEENANVRTRQAQRRGEWLRVWEWVGAVGSSMVKSKSQYDSNTNSNALKGQVQGQIQQQSSEGGEGGWREDQVMIEKQNGKGVSMR